MGEVKKMEQEKQIFSETKRLTSETQIGKGYRLGLAIKRINIQIIHGNIAEKIDFLKWLLSKFFKQKCNCKPLCVFDNLEPLKRNLDLLEMTIANHSSSIIKKNSQQVWIFDELSYSGCLGNTIIAEIAKAFNEMGFDVYYAFLENGNFPSIAEPVSKKINLKTTKMRDIVSLINNDALFIFSENNAKFGKYIEFGSSHKLKMVFLNNIKKEDECWVDNALFEPNLSYPKPPDINEKKNPTKIILVEGKDIDFQCLNNVARKQSQYEFYVLGHTPKEKTSYSSNIYFIGHKYKKDLPMYYKYADFIFLPIKNSSDPLDCKRMVYRHTAMQKTVITTESDCALFPNIIYCNSIDAICDKFQSFDSDNLVPDGFSINYNYYKLCNRILDLFPRKENKISISVIILNRNNKSVIFRCVDTLLQFNTYDYEIIVVDNDSTDGSYELLLEKYQNNKSVKIVKNNKNGCSSGRNLGVKYSNGEYIYFLDSDQWIIGDHWMDTAINIMAKHVGIGAVAWNAGWFYPEKLSALIVDYLPDRGIEPDMLYRTDIGLLATSGLLMKRSVFDIIKGFDEFYDPTCFEDTDLSFKIRNLGYETAYTPYMLIKHLPHQTTKSGSKHHKELMKRNELYCKKKWEEIDPTLFEYYY